MQYGPRAHKPRGPYRNSKVDPAGYSMSAGTVSVRL
jgi:hypothetical protein